MHGDVNVMMSIAFWCLCLLFDLVSFGIIIIATRRKDQRRGEKYPEPPGVVMVVVVLWQHLYRILIKIAIVKEKKGKGKHNRKKGKIIVLDCDSVVNAFLVQGCTKARLLSLLSEKGKFFFGWRIFC